MEKDDEGISTKRMLALLILCTFTSLILLEFYSIFLRDYSIRKKLGDYSLDKISAECFDYVDLGNATSETAHIGIYGWSAGANHLVPGTSGYNTTYYGGEFNPAVTKKATRINIEYMPPLRVATWKNTAGEYGVMFHVNSSVQKYQIKANFLESTYSSGNITGTPYPISVKYSCDNINWIDAGEIEVGSSGKWKTHTLTVDNLCQKNEKHIEFYVRLDDSRNFYSPDTHFGRTINWIAVCPT